MSIKVLPVAVIGVLFAFNAARASIISTTPSVVEIPAPPDVRVGALESDTQIVAFAERLAFTLAQDLPANITNPGTSPDGGVPNLSPGTIPAGTAIDSYFVHFDSLGANEESPVGIAGTITFSHDILGLIVNSGALDNTDNVIGVPGLLYPTVNNRGLELTPGDNALDIVTLSADRRTVTLNLLNAISVDQLRVITAVPEPSTWLLLAIGLCALVARRLRHSARGVSAAAVLVVASFTSVAPAYGEVIVDFAAVGHAGNAADTTGFGAVNYNYGISKFEITCGQYVEFLNAVDPTGANSLGLFGSFAGSAFNNVGRIPERPDGSKYSTGAPDLPVQNVSWYSAIRFVNWLNNGQGNADTETGSYTLLGGTATPANALSITRNPGATIYLPTEDEWYKAAYYNPQASSYFEYPTSSNTAPTASAPTSNPNSANWGFGTGFLTPVGAYGGTVSPYGLFDMAGNVDEWNEALTPGSSSRGVRTAGSFLPNPNLLRSTNRDDYAASLGSDFIGFRVVSVPEPSTWLLMSFGCAALAAWRRFSAHASAAPSDPMTRPQ